MAPEIGKFLEDILDAISGIEHHLGDKRKFQEYLANRTQKKAVERELEVIGEATSRILKLDPSISISHARSIVDMRNRVIHEYGSVDHTVVWKIIQVDLPILKSEITQLLQV